MTAVSPLVVPSIPGAPVVEVAWQGGEPTLTGRPFFRRTVELVDRYLHPRQSAVHTIRQRHQARPRVRDRGGAPSEWYLHSERTRG